MFKIQKKATFTWPVTVNVPRDGGGFVTHEFTAEFKLQEQSKLDRLLEQFRNEDRDILKELLVGWEGVSDAEGNVMLFTEETRDHLIDIPYVRTGLLKAYFESSSGNKVKKGN